jgi:voltage-gated potassium channel Kch
LLKKILVVDFNPVVLEELNRRGIKCIYGDVAHMDTLHHAKIDDAKVIASTIPDAILRGTNNLRLLRQAKRVAPDARVIVASDTIQGALDLYAEGADFVYVARLHSARHMAEIIERGLQDGLRKLREDELRRLKKRQEVLQ